MTCFFIFIIFSQLIKRRLHSAVCAKMPKSHLAQHLFAILYTFIISEISAKSASFPIGECFYVCYDIIIKKISHNLTKLQKELKSILIEEYST